MSDDKIPYGASPPEPQVEDKVEDVQVEEVVQEQEPEKPAMDYERSYKELQSKFGEHSNVVGELRKQNETLAQQVAEIQAQAAEREKAALNAEPPTDYEKMLAEVGEKVDNGELSISEGLLETNRITRERTIAEAEQEKASLLEQAKSEVQQILSEKDQQLADKEHQVVIDKFYESNPDFITLQESGEIQKAMAEDPLLDDLSAYWKMKADSAFEAGKAEQAKIAAGSERASQVIADQGSSMQTDKKPVKPSGEAGLKQSMLAALGSED